MFRNNTVSKGETPKKRGQQNIDLQYCVLQ